MGTSRMGTGEFGDGSSVKSDAMMPAGQISRDSGGNRIRPSVHCGTEAATHVLITVLRKPRTETRPWQPAGDSLIAF